MELAEYKIGLYIHKQLVTDTKSRRGKESEFKTHMLNKDILRIQDGKFLEEIGLLREFFLIGDLTSRPL